MVTDLDPLPCQQCRTVPIFRPGDDPGSLFIGCVPCDLGLELSPAPGRHRVVDLRAELTRIWNDVQRECPWSSIPSGPPSGSEAKP